MAPEIRYNFDRTKPFYPIVTTYLIQLLGIKEVAVLGLPDLNRGFTLTPEVAQKSTQAEREALEKSLQTMLGPLSLKISDDAERLEIPLQFIAKELANHYDSLLGYNVQAAWYCIVMAHEVTVGKPYRDKSELWEFLRHCRNAVAHNGKWNLRGNEPKYRASWRGISLDQSFNGQNLFKTDDKSGTLELGDPIAFLHDIESKFPNMY